MGKHKPDMVNEDMNIVEHLASGSRHISVIYGDPRKGVCMEDAGNPRI